MAKQVGIGYPIAHKAQQTIIRRADLVYTATINLFGEVEAGKAYFGGRQKGNWGRGAAGKVPVFIILERNSIFSVDVVPDVSAKTPLDLTVRKIRIGSIIYTDRHKSYDSLMCCGYRHLTIEHKRYFSSGSVYIN